jgi:hypothetical protein
MSDNSDKFHIYALQSILFKGRSDWYFCFLKAEKIAHALLLLNDHAPQDSRNEMHELCSSASHLPKSVLDFASGELPPEAVLADIFGLLSHVRLCTTGGSITKENGTIVVAEYERLAERFSASLVPSPFLSPLDFTLPAEEQAPALPLQDETSIYRTNLKGQSKGQSERAQKILDFVLKNKGVSIKNIALAISDCSEKTIQRELGALVQKGQIKRVGDRRWSVYLPA